MQVGQISYWYRTLEGVPSAGPRLQGNIAADVCIVGGGYTGLWTAYYLKQTQPNLNIVILEKEFCGFGASGRNGGWLSGVFPWSTNKYAATSGVEATQRFVQAMQETVPEVVTQIDNLGIDVDLHQTSELSIATNPAQLARLEEDFRFRTYWGEKNLTLLSQREAKHAVKIPRLLGATRSSGVARINPAKLVRGLTAAVQKLGVTIYEGTEVTHIEKNKVTTALGSVATGAVVQATEGYTATFSGAKRDILPLNSAQIITERLPDSMWAELGWEGRELIGDYANMYCYCQRTIDGRIAVGSRGTPYRFGSKFSLDGSPDKATIRQLQGILKTYFPAAAALEIDHAWGGILGVPRDWCAQVQSDTEKAMFSAGGYVGVGVATSNLAARTLRDLILERDTDLTTLPWVNRPVKRWEPEPLRWLGVRGMYGLYRFADWTEKQFGISASPLATLGSKIAGK